MSRPQVGWKAITTRGWVTEDETSVRSALYGAWDGGPVTMDGTTDSLVWLAQAQRLHRSRWMNGKQRLHLLRTQLARQIGWPAMHMPLLPL